MSFTSRDLRGWFQTFTSLPLVHTPNLDFWSDVFDLSSSKTPKFLFMKTTLKHIVDFIRFLNPRTSPVSDHPETDSIFTNRSQVQLLLSHIIRRLAWCMIFIKISLWILPSRETEQSSRRRPTNLSTNLVDPTFRGCKVFAQFPNTSPSGKRVDSDDPVPRINLEFW
jgi:hypothetical protein